MTLTQNFGDDLQRLGYALGTLAHKNVVVLMISEDESESHGAFYLTPERADDLADRLKAWAKCLRDGPPNGKHIKDCHYDTERKEII